MTHPEEAVRHADVLTVRRRGVHLRRYDAFCYDGDATWFSRASETGLPPLRDIHWDGVDGYVVMAFIDHWQPETNSFHFPWGEMTITLHDVACLLGLPITGARVTRTHTDVEVQAIVQEMYGVTDEDMTKYRTAGGFPVSVMLARFADTHGAQLLQDGSWSPVGQFDIADQVGLRRLTTAYLSTLIAGTLFVDKSGTAIRWDLIGLVLDVDRAATLAWGVGVLAHLYRALGKATRVGAKQLDSCLTLLQVISFGTRDKFVFLIYLFNNCNGLIT